MQFLGHLFQATENLSSCRPNSDSSQRREHLLLSKGSDCGEVETAAPFLDLDPLVPLGPVLASQQPLGAAGFLLKTVLPD